jgi:hypothetical protein
MQERVRQADGGNTARDRSDDFQAGWQWLLNHSDRKAFNAEWFFCEAGD